ncbi:hypothetical protein DASC09_002870 [Saccharomycopsis crataegensis]|uniref:NADP-dependent oxidoreductase domain-containing protein n=1 Tax=Saccharomycopsis crataegensis TaxID=43959 RepID=A0AAV5QE72_9ASCO|nr:hypothetical protein DASC09_002870 [Saccharomycopsis crataegensis]
MPLTKNTKVVKLNDGNEIPVIGLGTFRSGPNEVYQAVLDGIKAGVRHIDTAYAYGNEEEIGTALTQAFKEGLVKREELFITTKMWGVDYADPESAIKLSLKKLQLDYVDLYMIHWPVALTKKFDAAGNVVNVSYLPNGKRDLDHSNNFVKTWTYFQDLVAKGLTKSIGVSNFTIAKLTELLAAPTTKIVPCVNQIEAHLYLLQPELLAFCKSKGIHVEAHTPLGGADAAELLKNPVIVELAKKYQASSAQILISWALWRGTIVLPKSVKAERIHDNLFTVELSNEDGEKINAIGKNAQKRFVNPDWSPFIVFDDDEKHGVVGASGWKNPNPTTVSN